MCAEYTNVIKETESFIIDLGNLLRERKTDLSRIKKEKQTASKLIKECCTTIRDTLNILERKSIDELNANASKKIKTIESQTEYLEGIREKAGDILRRINICHGKNESKFFRHVKEGKQLAKDAEVKIREIKDVLHTECIQYVINADIENVIRSLVSLGSILNKRKITPECSDIHKTTTKPLDTHSITSECTDAGIATTEFPKTNIETDESPNIHTTTTECNETHKGTTEYSDALIETTECSHTHKAKTACSDTPIAKAESFDARTTIPKLSEINQIRPELSYIQPDDSIVSSPDVYENLTKKNDIPLDPIQTTNMDCLRIYDTLPLRKETNCYDTPVGLSKTSVKPKRVHFNECISNSYETVSFSNHPNTNTSKADEGNEYSDAGLLITGQQDATKAANSFTDISLAALVSTQPSSDIWKPADAFKWHKPIPIMRFNVKEHSDHHNCNIYDVCQCLDGKLLLIDDRNHKIKRFDESYKFRDSLQMPDDPYCVCTAGPKMAAVSLRRGKKIQFVHTGKKLSFAKSFGTGNYCRGMAYVDGYLNVCTGDIHNPSSGRIEVYNNNGNLQYCIPKEPQRLQTVLKYIAVTEVGKNRFVTMYSSDSVTLLSVAGTSDGIFRHENLKQPEGICTDGKGNIFVCGFHSNNVFRVSPQHQQVEEILNEKDGIKKPIAVYYDGLQSRLFISCSHSNEVLIFTVK